MGWPSTFSVSSSISRFSPSALVSVTCIVVIPPCTFESGLAAARTALARQGHRLLVVTPTLKAAEVAAAETGADGHSAAWLIHQHGWRWDDDGHWARRPDATPAAAARLRRGDLLLVDEAGQALPQAAVGALLRTRRGEDRKGTARCADAGDAVCLEEGATEE